jgi:hydrogenase maturation protein HypF
MTQTSVSSVSSVSSGVRSRRRVRVRGVVQGVGFRPFIYVTATRLGLTGSVGNDGDGVMIDIEGDADALDELVRSVLEHPPELAVVVSVESEDLDIQGGSDFTIEVAQPAAQARTLVSPDIATCLDCLRELADPGDRRYRHPFINCTNCGPRFTVITGLHYDRSATTMARFALCSACRAEYEDPNDRRFHAQPIGCPDCGPTLELVAPDSAAITGAVALQRAREWLSRGSILAIKGVGGYHLACDAANETAVARLRQFKRRGAKPFALMVADVATATTIAELDDHEAALLSGRRRPIVLLRRKAGANARVAPSVAPGNAELGLMLPNAAVHSLLFGLDGDPPGPQVLVMTSGNLGGEPIAIDDVDALRRLSAVVDGWLRHDRPIHVPCDDSVMRVVDGRQMFIRRSRGYAPLPIELPFEVGPALAVGADLKSTCAVSRGRYAWLSQHIGDLDDLATLDAFETTQGHLQSLSGVTPTLLAVDAHPGYRSSRWARANAAGRDVVPVQHHHAHIASVMAEHGVDGREPVIGIAFDGTGFGDDGAIWGGELLMADYRSYRRSTHLSYVPLAGGDVSVRRPYRMALAHLDAAGIGWDESIPSVAACPPVERALLRRQFQTGFGCVPTSSMGRLFDAVASLIGVCHVIDFEAQAAITLESTARETEAAGYSFGHDVEGLFDAAPLIRRIVADLADDVSPTEIAGRFHHAVAELVSNLATTVRADTGLNVVVLSGGVFQNVRLLVTAGRLLEQAGFVVLRPSLLPPNDGGIALGQIMVAASRRRDTPCA